MVGLRAREITDKVVTVMVLLLALVLSVMELAVRVTVAGVGAVVGAA